MPKKTKPQQLVEFLQDQEGGLSQEEIARHMNISIGSVAAAISRARKICPKGVSIWCYKSSCINNEIKITYGIL